MKTHKRKSTSNKYFLNKPQHKNKIYNSLMSEYIDSNNPEINNVNKNEIKNNILLNNKDIKNLFQSDEIIIQNNENENEYTKMKYIFPLGGGCNDYSKNDSKENWRKKLFLQKISFSTKNKDLNIKDQKIKREILSSENDGFRNNKNNFNKTSYPISKYTNNEEEPFYFNDKYISNSFIINYDDKTKKYSNNEHNQNPSKLLSIDLPSSLNNTDRYISQKNDYENKINEIYIKNKTQYDSLDYPSDIITFRKKENIYNKDNNNKTIEAEKIKKPKKIIRKNIRNKPKSFIKNLTENNLEFNIYNNIDSHNIYNNCEDFKISNNINDYEQFKNLRDSNDITSNKNTQKIILHFPKIKSNNNLKNLLFSNNDNNALNDKNEDKNDKQVENKNYLNKSRNLDNYDIFVDKSNQPSEIESYVISFRKSKTNFNKDEKKWKKNNLKTNLNKNAKKYMKKKNAENKNYINYTVNRRYYINDEETYDINNCNYTNSPIYKKPNLSISQNIKNNFVQNTNEENAMSQSHFNIYKSENNNNDIELDMFYKRQYLGDIFIKYKNKTKSQNIAIFRKKLINTVNRNIKNKENNCSNHINSPIYTKKSPSILRAYKKNKNSDNIENNSLSNTQYYINKRNNNYLKTPKINSNFRLFNSQIINIRNNIYNNNENNSNKNKLNNNTPFGEYILTEPNKIKNLEIKAFKKINSTIINDHSFYIKYYNYFSDIEQKESKIFYYNNKRVKNNEIIMNKVILPLYYISKKRIKIFQIPHKHDNYYSKIYIIKRKLDKNIIKKNNKELNNKEYKINKNMKIKKKHLININQNKEINTLTINPDNKIKYDSKTIKDEEIVESNQNKKLIRINVMRKNKRKNNKKDNNNFNKEKEFNNFQKKKTNETEFLNYNYYDNEFIICDGNIEIINYPKIPQSPQGPPKLKLINSNKEEKIEVKKDSKKSQNKSKTNYLLRKRSLSIKIINKKKIKTNESINVLRIKLPNSESRRKKYKINIVKRLKIKYKKNFGNFSEEKILINNCNNDINEEIIIKRNDSIKKSKEEIEKDRKIILIIKEDLENYILFSLKNNKNKNMIIINYNYTVIGQLLIKEKIDLSYIIKYYLKISFEIIDSKDKIIIANDYINNIIEKYKRTYLNKNNFIQIHEDILDILVNIITDENKKNENKYKFDIVGALFYSLLINELFFVSDLNMFINCEKQIYINIAKIVRYIIIYSNDDKFKTKYFEIFKKSKLFFNNPIYFKYITKYLKFLNIEIL